MVSNTDDDKALRIDIGDVRLVCHIFIFTAAWIHGWLMGWLDRAPANAYHPTCCASQLLDTRSVDGEPDWLEARQVQIRVLIYLLGCLII